MVYRCYNTPSRQASADSSGIVSARAVRPAPLRRQRAALRARAPAVLGRARGNPALGARPRRHRPAPRRRLRPRPARARAGPALRGDDRRRPRRRHARGSGAARARERTRERALRARARGGARRARRRALSRAELWAVLPPHRARARRGVGVRRARAGRRSSSWRIRSKAARSRRAPVRRRFPTRHSSRLSSAISARGGARARDFPRRRRIAGSTRSRARASADRRARSSARAPRRRPQRDEVLSGYLRSRGARPPLRRPPARFRNGGRRGAPAALGGRRFWDWPGDTEVLLAFRR